MAVTVAIVKRIKMGNAKGSIVDVGFDSSYPTGGESVTPEQCGLNVVNMVLAEPGGGYNFQYVRSTSKLKAFYANNDGAADGPLIEVADKTNLSTVTTRVFVLGW